MKLRIQTTATLEVKTFKDGAKALGLDIDIDHKKWENKKSNSSGKTYRANWVTVSPAKTLKEGEKPAITFLPGFSSIRLNVMIFNNKNVFVPVSEVDGQMYLASHSVYARPIAGQAYKMLLTPFGKSQREAWEADASKRNGATISGLLIPEAIINKANLNSLTEVIAYGLIENKIIKQADYDKRFEKSNSKGKSTPKAGTAPTAGSRKVLTGNGKTQKQDKGKGNAEKPF